jgi:aspartate aminotransferase-like enzyme
MITYPIPMVPGPVKVPADVLQAYLTDYGSADLEPEYLELYRQVEADLQQIFATRNPFAIMTGEGMLALWSALKSCLLPGDRVLAVATGVFGYGVGDLARSAGAEVRTVGFGYDQTIADWEWIEAAIAEFRPKMITAIHCETPSGTLNPLAELGRLKAQYGVPLLYVDAVASAAGAEVLTDAWQIDLMLGGTQKALSVPPSLSLVAVSPRAWEIIDEVDYPAMTRSSRSATRWRTPTSPTRPTGRGWRRCAPAPAGCWTKACRRCLPATRRWRRPAARAWRRSACGSTPLRARSRRRPSPPRTCRRGSLARI